MVDARLPDGSRVNAIIPPLAVDGPLLSIRRFGTDVSGGFAAQVDFVSTGSLRFKAYGNNGIGTGRMPGFGQMLTKKYIEEIVSYERYCLNTSTFLRTEPLCVTGTVPRTNPTTTTAAASAKG